MLPLSVLDLAPISSTGTARESFEASVALARLAESSGYRRVWYAEHHNMSSIASSATSVLIAHVAAHTSMIRLGAGGIMLPNHAPLTIAEQFGTLETLHPGRIDLGLGRAPGSDQNTARALRRDPRAADQFPQDVLELQGYLRGRSLIPGVQAVPGAGTDVPLYILGSSLSAPGWPRRWACPTRSPRTSRRPRCTRPSLSTAGSSSPRSSWTSPMSSSASTSSQPTTPTTRPSSSSACAAPGCSAC